MSETIYQATADGLQEVSLPEYLCHKIVRAAKIVGVALSPTPGFHRLALEGAAHVDVTRMWYGNRAPQPGGYYVQYKDGYSSYSPAEAFEAGYEPIWSGTAASANQIDAGGYPADAGPFAREMIFSLRNKIQGLMGPAAIPIVGTIGDPGAPGDSSTANAAAGPMPTENLPENALVRVIDRSLAARDHGPQTVSHIEHINGRVYYSLKGWTNLFLASQLEMLTSTATESSTTGTEPQQQDRPSAEDLDAVAEDQTSAEQTSGAEADGKAESAGEDALTTAGPEISATESEAAQ